jgi:hypothetical protein
MVNFIIGFVVAWILLGTILFAADEKGDIILWDDLTTYFLLLPLIPFILLSMFIKKIKRK